MARVFALCAPALVLTACSEGPFDIFQASAQIQAQAIQLDGEQVLIAPDQIACAERADLLVILPLGGGRSVGEFKQAGRDLGFTDNIHIGDPGFPTPYTQIRGKFPLLVHNVIMTDLDESTKIVEAQVNVRINHRCFEHPPRLMGIYKGHFTATANPTFQFRRHGEAWKLASLQH